MSALSRNLFVESLKNALGDEHVQTDEALFAPKLLDNRSRYRGHVTCTVFPANTQEASAVMRLAHLAGANVFVQGGNTSNVAGATPVQADDPPLSVLISTDRMRTIESIDTVNNTAVVQTGVVVENLQKAAADKNRLFAVSLASQGSCTVGGILASNAGGVHVLYYGNSREQCLGLEVVLSDGRVLNMLRGLRKDNTGYDIKDLFISSEGTLGVITRAVVKLWPRPVGRIVVFLSLENTASLGAAFKAFEGTLSESLTAFEVMHRDTVAHVAKVWPEITRGIRLDCAWYALAELSFFSGNSMDAADAVLEETLASLFAEGFISDAIVGQSETQNEALWKIRESIPEAHKKTGGNVKHDISVPRSRLGEFVDVVNARLKNRFPWIKPSVFGHFGDGNLHYNMGVLDGFDQRLCFAHEDEIHETVYRAVEEFGGSVAAEHGVGRMKKDLLSCVKDEVEYDVMRRIKTVFDAQGKLNPGALIDPMADH